MTLANNNTSSKYKICLCFTFKKYYNDLATFDNEEEHDQVVQTLTSEGYTGGVWIGLYDDRYSWRWSNSKKNMTYTNWAGNEPSNYQSKEACAWLYFTGFWHDDQCGNPLPVLRFKY
uniref:C-type lectin domain-containing protein n=1 Tax=Cyprinus carpio TaxID=7962 RepID=A0A8C1GJ67_CYPCA